MKKYCFTPKAIIVALFICGALIPAIAQIQRNTLINFYGKVVDQNGRPIAGTTVKLVIAADPSENSVPEEKDYTLETDQEGNFHLSGALGWSLHISSITKPGYQLSQKTKMGYPYLMASGIHHPDSNAPVLFKMWKSVGKGPLAHSAWHGKVTCDGTTDRFDLTTGRPSTNGVLEITCSRAPVNLPPANTKPFTYKLEIAIVGGGIQATDDEFTYLPPENNYMPSFVSGQTADNPKWDRNTPIPKEYYIKTPDGHYGRLRVEWDLAGQSPTALKWECSINPSGSRNLER